MTTPPISEVIEELRRTAEKAEPIAVELYGDRLFGGPYSRADFSAAQDAYIEAAQPSAILALLEHVEGLERDARRYRWLVDSDSLERPSVTLGEAYQKYTGGMLDAAIDREMGALAEQGEKV